MFSLCAKTYMYHAAFPLPEVTPVTGEHYCGKQHCSVKTKKPTYDWKLCSVTKLTSLCSASYVSWQQDNARSCCWALAVQQSTHIFCLPCPNQQTRYNSMQRPSDGTDRRTPDCYIDPAPNTMRAVSTTVQQYSCRRTTQCFKEGKKLFCCGLLCCSKWHRITHIIQPWLQMLANN